MTNAKIVIFTLAVACFLFYTPPLEAATIYIDDEFNDTTQVDMGKTDAEVDTVNGWVVLSRKNVSSSIGLYEDSYDITIINGNKIETYQYDGTSMVKTNSLSVNTGLTNPISLSVQSSGQYLVLDQGTNTVTHYNFDGSSMVANPYLSVSGLLQPVTVSVQKDTMDFAVTSRDNSRVTWYSFDGTGMVLNNALSTTLGASANPIDMAISGSNYDYAVIDKATKTIKYFSFDGSSMAVNPYMSITTPGALVNPLSISLSDTEAMYAVVDGADVKVYNFDGSSMQHNPYLSLTGLNRPLAVALKPGSFDYAVLHYDASDAPVVSYYAFSGTEMVKIDSLTITGIADITYNNDQYLTGKPVDAPYSVIGVKLQATVELPAGTSITWEVTNDGTTWVPIQNHGSSVRFATTGSTPTYRARLHTDDPNVTPKILNVVLIDASLAVTEMRIVSIVGPVIESNPELPASFPPTTQIAIWAGYNVTFEIDTSGTAQTLVTEIEVAGDTINLSSLLGELTPTEPLTSYFNTWQGTFHCEPEVPTGTELDMNVTVGADPDYEYVSYDDFAIIEGSALAQHPIHLTH